MDTRGRVLVIAEPSRYRFLHNETNLTTQGVVAVYYPLRHTYEDEFANMSCPPPVFDLARPRSSPSRAQAMREAVERYAQEYLEKRHSRIPVPLEAAARPPPPPRAQRDVVVVARARTRTRPKGSRPMLSRPGRRRAVAEPAAL